MTRSRDDHSAKAVHHKGQHLLTIVCDKRLCGILESCVESLDDAGLHLVVRVAILCADEGCKLSSLLPHRPMVLNSTALQHISSL